MKSLSTLIKLMKTRVDDQRQFLAKMQAELDQIELAIMTLTTQCAYEQETATEHPEYALTYADFIQKAIKRSRDLEKRKLSAVISVEIARDQLAELFEEQKRYEIAQENRDDEEVRQESQRETQELDEVGSVSFVRKMRK